MPRPTNFTPPALTHPQKWEDTSPCARGHEKRTKYAGSGTIYRGESLSTCLAVANWEHNLHC
jgi:hypothetical protein